MSTRDELFAERVNEAAEILYLLRSARGPKPLLDLRIHEFVTRQEPWDFSEWPEYTSVEADAYKLWPSDVQIEFVDTGKRNNHCWIMHEEGESEGATPALAFCSGAFEHALNIKPHKKDLVKI